MDDVLEGQENVTGKMAQDHINFRQKSGDVVDEDQAKTFKP